MVLPMLVSLVSALSLSANGEPLLPKSRYAHVRSFAHVDDEPYPERYLYPPQPFMLPKGLMLATGFERGFIAAAAFPNVDGLLVLDGDPANVTHVRVNAQLLAQMPYDYYAFVRNKADVCLQGFAMDQGLELEDARSFFTCSDRMSRGYFKGLAPEMNYWKNEGSFRHLQNMARAQKIVAEPIGFFSTGEPLKQLVKELQEGRETTIAMILLGDQVARLVHQQGLADGLHTLRSFLTLLQPALSPEAIALYVHPVRSGDPWYENVKIETLLQMDDVELAKTFLSDCEFTLASMKKELRR